MAGALLGFFIATVAILLGLLDSSRPRLQTTLGGGRAVMIQRIFFAAIRVTAVGLLFGLALLVLDNDETLSGWIAGVLVGICILGILRTARLIWFLKRLLIMATRNDPSDDSDEMAAAQV